VRGAVVDPQRAGTSQDINAKGFPGKRLLENTLAQVPGKKEPVFPPAADGGKKPELCNADILGLINNDTVKWRTITLLHLLGNLAEFYPHEMEKRQ